jgi:hypothetical protein
VHVTGLCGNKKEGSLSLHIMSTPPDSGAVDAKNGDRRMSLGKYVKRMSSVFKREKPARSSGATGAAAPSVPEDEPEVARKEPAEQAVAPAA